jgi:polyhydroxybutyrate depolymerase
MSRKTFIGAVAILLALPFAFALFAALSFRLHNGTNGSLVSSGEKREYLLYVPRSYDPSRPSPLVISLHGAGGWPAQQMRVSEWNTLAERERFIVVYPAGARSAGPRIWHAMREPELEKDVRFISDLIGKLERDYNIDRARIYANGLSNGGGMSFVLSCTLSDRIAAVGLVAAAQTLPWRWCTDDRPVPMIAFHGTADPVIPYRGGPSWISHGLFPDVSAWASKWAKRNHCEPHAAESAVASDVIRREYSNCADDASVILYTIKGGGHSWPGGGPLPRWLVGPTTHSINATNEMWSFFRAHPLRRASGKGDDMTSKMEIARTTE